MLINWPTERPHFGYVTSVTDGDTFRADIDLDLRAGYWDYKIRLAGCNAWEKSTEAGMAAKDNLAAILTPKRQIILTTIKDYKYGGEFVAKVFLPQPDGSLLELVPQLIAEQWLAPWDGRGSAPLPAWPRTI